MIEDFIYRSEGDTLDFKGEQYRFAGESKEVKAELLKDVLAMANSWGESDRHILIGVKAQAAPPHQIVGIGSEDHIDDANIQEFVNKKINKPIRFAYEVVTENGKSIGVIWIQEQLSERPFYLLKDYGRLKKEEVYIRRSSSTDTATPDEIARMGRVAVAKLDRTALVTENSVRPFISVKIEPISVDDLRSKHPHAKIDKPQIRITLQNIGKSPAVKLRTLVQFGKGTGAHFGEEIEFGNAWSTGTATFSALAPGDEFSLGEIDIFTSLGISLDQTIDSHRTSFVVVVSFQYQDMVRRTLVNDTSVHVLCVNLTNKDRTMIGFGSLGGHEERILSTWHGGTREQFFEGSGLYAFDKTFPA